MGHRSSPRRRRIRRVGVVRLSIGHDAWVTALMVSVGTLICLGFAVTCDAELARELGDFVTGYIQGE